MNEHDDNFIYRGHMEPEGKGHKYAVVGDQESGYTCGKCRNLSAFHYWKCRHCGMVGNVWLVGEPYHDCDIKDEMTW